MKEYLEEMEYMRWLIVQKFIDGELNSDSLSRMVTHSNSLAYQFGRKHERKYMEVDKNE